MACPGLAVESSGDTGPEHIDVELPGTRLEHDELERVSGDSRRLEREDARIVVGKLGGIVLPHQASLGRQRDDGGIFSAQIQPALGAGCCWVMQWTPPPRANNGRASTLITRRPGYCSARIAMAVRSSLSPNEQAMTPPLTTRWLM